MKTIAIILLLVPVLAAAQDNGTIIFGRKIKYVGQLTVFIDGKPVCKLNNKKYSTHQVPAGEHTVAITYSSAKLKDKAEEKSLPVTVMAGKAYYFKAIEDTKVMMVKDLHLEEVTKPSWDRYSKKLKPDNCL